MLGKNNFTQGIQRLTPSQLLLCFYFLAIIISTIVLSLPVAYQEGVHVPFIDVLFTAVSALSVTGLSTISVGDTLSTTGIILLALILQLGAVGVMSVSTFIRSEEHTSELQSRGHLVCRLLLEKKKRQPSQHQ